MWRGPLCVMFSFRRWTHIPFNRSNISFITCKPVNNFNIHSHRVFRVCCFRIRIVSSIYTLLYTSNCTANILLVSLILRCRCRCRCRCHSRHRQSSSSIVVVVVALVKYHRQTNTDLCWYSVHFVGFARILYRSSVCAAAAAAAFVVCRTHSFSCPA